MRQAVYMGGLVFDITGPKRLLPDEESLFRGELSHELKIGVDLTLIVAEMLVIGKT